MINFVRIGEKLLSLYHAVSRCSHDQHASDLGILTVSHGVLILSILSHEGPCYGQGPRQ